MLKLLIFVPCDKAIISDGGQSSLIGVLEEVQVGVPQKGIPPTAMIPYKWSILTLWHREEEVVAPESYHVRINLIRPDGVQALKVEADITVTNEYRNYRNSTDIPFLPAGLEGLYNLELFLQKEQDKPQRITTFPIVITHKQTEDEVAETPNQENEEGHTSEQDDKL